MSSRVSETLPHRVRRRVSWFVRDRWPYRPVERTVQGVPMVLPWSHRLPDYAQVAPDYGQNLVELARELGADGPVTMLDIGANVGDSALQVMAATDAEVLCVEADPRFLEFLHRNVDRHDGVEVEPSLLVTDADGGGDVVSVSRGGTAHFAEATEGSATPVRKVSVTDLRASYPRFDRLRLVKSDTDGFDVRLVPETARVWSDAPPVLFFEYDHVLSRQVGNDPLAVWSELADLGYETVAVWDYAGAPVGLLDVRTLPERASVLDETDGRRAHPYWDVAVAHRDDATATAALGRLMETTAR